MGHDLNIFALAPGVDFASELIRGIDARLGDDPMQVARAEIWVNTERARRRILEVYNAGPARLMPRIRIITDLADQLKDPLEPGISALRRRLDIQPLVAGLLSHRPDLMGQATSFDLTDSLALLFTEMADEAVTPETLRALDVRDASDHWQENLKFLSIASSVSLKPDRATQQRDIVDALIDQWENSPPDRPIFLAGSTGSRGPSFALMAALAKHDLGHVILPGFDFNLTKSIWDSFEAAENPEDHPQYRYFRMARHLGIRPEEIAPWTDTAVASPDLNRLMSLALRPAPVTHGWMRDGPDLGPLAPICGPVTLIEASDPRTEAIAIALKLRHAAENGTQAALITPDRRLARRVKAALDQWKIIPDDSAGDPLGLMPQGRLLRAVARMLGDKVRSEPLIALLSNPVTATGSDRVHHLAQARAFEVYLRRAQILYPGSVDFEKWAERFPDADPVWFAWIQSVFAELDTVFSGGLKDLAQAHVDICERLADGPKPENQSSLWTGPAGEEAAKIMSGVIEAAEGSHIVRTSDYHQLLEQVIGQSQVREATTPYPGIMIWGTLEARVQAVDLAILGGLNEGVWPKTPEPDAWLSRGMRREAGLLLPERRIGLSSHDFQAAAGAKEVVLSRAIRDEDAMTVPSRWVNRLTNLLAGLPHQGGPEALEDMRKRGNNLLSMAAALDSRKQEADRAPRPAPAPPASARPRRLSVTQIKTLVRDPYAIYASKVLGLYPLETLEPKADARLRGNEIHKVLEDFIRDASNDPSRMKAPELVAAARARLEGIEDFPAQARLWLAELSNIADRFVREDLDRWSVARPAYFERKGTWEINLPVGGRFTLSGIADRIDLSEDGNAWIYDYKTGKPPTESQQIYFDRQLHLLALMAEAGVFTQKGATPFNAVSGVGFLEVGRNISVLEADLEKNPLDVAYRDLLELLSAFMSEGLGFAARAKMERSDHDGDYDHLSRRGEWDETNPATKIEVGK